jgi:hypothetical protein
MTCKELLFSDHAITQMFKRSIPVEHIKWALEHGEIITSYPTDKPYPSYLVLGYTNNRVVHIVVGKDEITGRCIIVTAYEPDPNIWEPDFKTKRK